MSFGMTTLRLSASLLIPLLMLADATTGTLMGVDRATLPFIRAAVFVLSAAHRSSTALVTQERKWRSELIAICGTLLSSESAKLIVMGDDAALHAHGYHGRHLDRCGILYSNPYCIPTCVCHASLMWLPAFRRLTSNA